MLCRSKLRAVWPIHKVRRLRLAQIGRKPIVLENVARQLRVREMPPDWHLVFRGECREALLDVDDIVVRVAFDE
jgi:hypothetical protein